MAEEGSKTARALFSMTKTECLKQLRKHLYQAAFLGAHLHNTSRYGCQHEHAKARGLLAELLAKQGIFTVKVLAAIREKWRLPVGQ
jgi:hypothetical protein